MKKSVLPLVLAAFAAFPAFAHLATDPAVPDAQWMRSWWMKRFDEKKALAAQGGYPVVFVGDSITHFWETNGRAAWSNSFETGECRALNSGFSADRTENVLWRLRHGQLDGADPKAVVLMIGTNNTGHRKVEEESALDTFLGIRAIIEDLDARFPQAVKVICPIFPRGATTNDALRVRNDHVNQALYRYVVSERQRGCKDTRITWCDVGSGLLDANGVLSKEMAKDLLHPGPRGYEIWAERLRPHLDYALGKTDKMPRTKSWTAAPTCADEATLPKTCRANPKNYWLSGMRVQAKGNLKRLNHRLRQKRDEIQRNAERRYDVVMVGDSITDFWERNFGQGESYVALTNRFKTLNVGFGGFHTEDVIWTTLHGGMADGYTCEAFTLMIGTNNREDSAEDVAAGVRATIAALKAKQPLAKVALVSILPWQNSEEGDRNNAKNVRVNALLKGLADGTNVVFVDLYGKFLNPDGTTNASLLKDRVHPNEAGYRLWADALVPVLDRLVTKR